MHHGFEKTKSMEKQLVRNHALFLGFSAASARQGGKNKRTGYAGFNLVNDIFHTLLQRHIEAEITFKVAGCA